VKTEAEIRERVCFLLELLSEMDMYETPSSAGRVHLATALSTLNWVLDEPPDRADLPSRAHARESPSPSGSPGEK